MYLRTKVVAKKVLQRVLRKKILKKAATSLGVFKRTKRGLLRVTLHQIRNIIVQFCH